MNTMKDFKNALFKRREVLVSIENASNPGIGNATKELASQFKVQEDVVVIKSLKSAYGKGSFLVDALIYDSIEAKDSIEPKKKEKKVAA